MKTLGIILQMALFSSAFPVQAQETTAVGDTSILRSVLVIDPGVALGKFTVLIPPSLQPGRMIAPLSFTDMFPGTVPPFLPVYGPKADLMSPFLLQRQKESALSTIYSIIGAVELGGAAYIAYRHIKKYGLR